MKRAVFFTAILIAILCITPTADADVTIPSTFSSGTPAIAASVNANFAYLGSVMPAIASSNNLNSISLSAAGKTTLSTLTVNVPGPGYLQLIGHASLGIDHTNGTTSAYNTGISTTAGQFDTNSYRFQSYYAIPSGNPTGAYYVSPSPKAIDIIPSKGTYTYYLIGSHGGGNTGFWYRSNLIAIFFPASLGNISHSLGDIVPLGSPVGDQSLED